MMKEEGKSIDEIAAWLEENKLHVVHKKSLAHAGTEIVDHDDFIVGIFLSKVHGSQTAAIIGTAQTGRKCNVQDVNVLCSDNIFKKIFRFLRICL